jgi:hypothetical protein
MTRVQQWGRKESIIWPPRGFYYTYCAIFLAVVMAGFLMYVHFRFSFSPLEKYYLPYYIRSGLADCFAPLECTNSSISPREISLSVGHGRRCVRRRNSTTVRQALPLALSDSALKAGDRYIFRESQHPYKNKELHTWLAHPVRI